MYFGEGVLTYFGFVWYVSMYLCECILFKHKMCTHVLCVFF